MGKLSIKLLVMAILSLVAGVSYAQDTSHVYLSTSDLVQPGENFILEVNLQNPLAVRGVEFYLTPSPNVVSFQESVTTTRTDGFMHADTVYNGTTLRILLSDFGGADILPGDGAILRLEYTVNATASGEFAFNFSNVLVVGPASTTLPSTVENLIVEVYTGLAGEDITRPTGFDLLSNFPNPFNPGTMLTLNLNKSQSGVMRIYNAMGQEIVSLPQTHFEAGPSQLYWDGTDNSGVMVPSGLYLCRFVGSHTRLQQKLILSR